MRGLISVQDETRWGSGTQIELRAGMAGVAHSKDCGRGSDVGRPFAGTEPSSSAQFQPPRSYFVPFYFFFVFVTAKEKIEEGERRRKDDVGDVGPRAAEPGSQ